MESGDELERNERVPDSDMDALRESEEVQEREFYGADHGVAKGSHSEQLWLISYSDFMTIMMIFFLAMFGYSHMVNDQVERSVDRFAALASEMKAKMKDDVRVVQDIDKVTVELGEGILFKSGSCELSPNATRTLAQIGSSLRMAEGEIIVEGHTDNVPIMGGAYASNWELSAARAFSVIQALKKSGVSAEHLAAWGFGENRPVVPNDTVENRRRNRRIDIVVLKKKIQGA